MPGAPVPAIAAAQAMHKESFLTRAANAGFALQSWNDLFSRWFPSQSLLVKVSAQGSKKTTNQEVLHTALSIAFGTIETRRALSNIGLKVNLDHVNNSVEVGFAVSTAAAIDMINVAMILAAQFGASVGQIGQDVVRGVGKELERWFQDAPWVKARKAIDSVTGNTPTVPGHDFDATGAGLKVVDAVKKIWDRINTDIGPGAVWAMARDEIVGGIAPGLMNTFKEQKPFDDMVDKVLLTRVPAANPQPPTATGNDLRTLVAQVLHDPSVRPPLPNTDVGPRTVASEERGV